MYVYFLNICLCVCFKVMENKGYIYLYIFIFPERSLFYPNRICLFSYLSFVCAQCKCWPGFHLKDDGKTCVDIDECSTTFPCSQRCINTYGSFKCLCVDGYEALERNPNTCKALSGQSVSTGAAALSILMADRECHTCSHATSYVLISAEEPFLIMADHHEIRKLSVDGSNYTILKQVGRLDTL